MTKDKATMLNSIVIHVCLMSNFVCAREVPKSFLTTSRLHRVAQEEHTNYMFSYHEMDQLGEKSADLFFFKALLCIPDANLRY